MTESDPRRRPSLRKVSSKTEPVPVDLSGCMVKWGIIVASVLLLLCIVSIGGLVALGQLQPMIERVFNQQVATIQAATSVPGSPTLAVANTEVPAGVGGWQVSSETSAIDGQKTVGLYLEATKDVAGTSGIPVKPVLYIRCQKGTLDTYIDTHSFLGLDKTSFVRYRFDGGALSTETLSVSTDNTALFFGRPASFITEAQKHTSLAFEFTPYQSGPQETTFDLTGLNTALEAMVGSCGFK